MMSYQVSGNPKEYRVVEVRRMPKTASEWASFTAARMEAGRLWTVMTKLHARIRRLNWKWPTYVRWAKWAKGKFPALSAQSVQQVIKDFCGALSATTAARKAQKAAKQEPTAKYPWKYRRYRDVPYTSQDAVIRNGNLRLSHGRGGNKALIIKLPKNRLLPGRLVEAQLAYGVIRLICEVAAKTDAVIGPPVGVDLGVNTLIAVTDGTKAVLVSGRGAKSMVRYRNKANAKLRSKIDRCKKGSRRHKKFTRAKYRMQDKGSRKLKDLLHKATRIVADEFPNSPVIVGKPFNDAAQKMDRVQAQQVSQASNAKIIMMLAYKMAGATQVSEHYSSQTCPVCGCRQKCRRVYECQECGFSAPRDVVGAVNILSIGIYGELRTNADMSIPSVAWRHPSKYLGHKPSSPGGIPAQVAA